MLLCAMKRQCFQTSRDLLSCEFVLYQFHSQPMIHCPGLPLLVCWKKMLINVYLTCQVSFQNTLTLFIISALTFLRFCVDMDVCVCVCLNGYELAFQVSKVAKYEHNVIKQLFELWNTFPPHTHSTQTKRTPTPTILSEFGRADQCGDGEAVSRADWQAASTPRHAAGAAAQPCPLVEVAVLVAGGGQWQVAVHILHTLAVTLKERNKGIGFTHHFSYAYTSSVMTQMSGGLGQKLHFLHLV